MPDSTLTNRAGHESFLARYVIIIIALGVIASAIVWASARLGLSTHFGPNSIFV